MKEAEVGFEVVSAYTNINLVDEYVGLDVETNSAHKLVFVQIYSPSQGKTFIFDVRQVRIKEKLQNILPTLPKVVGHNLFFDLSHIYEEFGTLLNVEADTFFLACSLQESEKGLKWLCKEYFDFPVREWESLFGNNTDYVGELNSEQLHYIANDPYYTCLLYEFYKSGGQFDFVKCGHKIDCQALPIYVKASVDGVVVDKMKFDATLELFRQETDLLQSELNQMAGRPVAVNSVKDVRNLLFVEQGLPIPPITTPRGEISVSKEALSFVDSPLVDKILELKESKSVLAASEKLPTLLDENSLLHPEYRVIGFDGTSRVYSSGPSISQIPRVIRNSMKPHTGKKFVFFDWKAAEVLIASVWAGCSKLLNAYNSEDLYTEIARDILGKVEITPEEREKIKVVVLSIMYGSQGGATARSLHISIEEAEGLVQRFYETYPEFPEFQNRAYNYCLENNYTSTFFFRPRILVGTEDEIRRKSVNTAVQGTCADVGKLAIVKAHETYPKFEFVTSVFDSFLFEVDEETSEDECIKFASFVSSCVAPFKFGFKIGISSDSWGDAYSKLERVAE